MARAFLSCAAFISVATYGQATPEVEVEESEEKDMQDTVEMMKQMHAHGRMALAGSGMAMKWGCYDEGEWKNSCDIAKDDAIIQESDWSVKCDPWKISVSATNKSRVWNTTQSHKHVTWSDDGKGAYGKGPTGHEWTCPEKFRSPSGCGDFLTDPRDMTCEESGYESKVGRWSFDRTSGYREERIVLTVGEPLMPQKHVCVQRPIFYENRNAETDVTPPMLGRHRERWPAWGEYAFIPPQRWLHAIEHGGVAFLYNHCMKAEDVCLIRRYIQKWKMRLEGGDLAHSRFRGSDRGGGLSTGVGEFRFVMTPFKHLQRAFAVVTWSEMYMSRGFNEPELDDFINKNYRKSWEDFQTSGKYNYLWENITAKNTSSCAADVDLNWQTAHKDAKQMHKELKSQLNGGSMESMRNAMGVEPQYRIPPDQAEQKWAAAQAGASELAETRLAGVEAEQLLLRRVVSGALVVSTASFVAMVVMGLVVFRLFKRRELGRLDDQESGSNDDDHQSLCEKTIVR